MVRLRSCFLLFPLLAPLRAEEIPPVFFPEADAASRREIDRIAKNLGDSDRNHRRDARSKLAEIGVWAIPRLQQDLKRGAAREKVNAALALARIAHPDALVALRAQADAPEDEARRAVCLALGVFRDPTDLGALVDLCANPRQRLGSLREAALALGKIPGAAPALAGATAKLPEDEHLAAALVLASALADPMAPLEPHLNHRKDVVQRAAAAGLLLRPPENPAAILDALRRGRGDEHTRALLYLALGPRVGAPEVRAALLDGATRGKEKTAARAAACVALGQEWGVAEHQPALQRALNAAKDDLAPALMYALLRTGTDEAVDAVLKQLRLDDEERHEPAAALLVHMLASVRDGAQHPRHEEICKALYNHRSDTVNGLGKAVLLSPWPEPFRAAALEKLAALETPDPHGLWSLAWDARAWHRVNDILGEILSLDDLPDWGKQSSVRTSTGEEVDDGRKRKSATPWEQDLISFLGEAPYFGPGDLR